MLLSTLIAIIGHKHNLLNSPILQHGAADISFDISTQLTLVLLNSFVSIFSFKSECSRNFPLQMAKIFLFMKLDISKIERFGMNIYHNILYLFQ